MKPASLLAELRQRGIELTVRGDDIFYRAPAGAITDELLQSFRARKQSLVTELRAEQQAGSNALDKLAKTLNADDANGKHAHAFGRFVEPVKAQLLSRVALDIKFVRGQGCYLWDESGTRYLDFIAQYGGLPLGYNPPEVWQALDRVRSKQLPNVATQTLLDSAGRFAERLIQLAPTGFEHVIFCNSGAEATEVAIKLCRAAGNRPGILSTRQGFHGLTTGSLAATGSEAFQNGFFVRCDDFQHIPFGDADALEDMLRRNPNQFAAFIVEPVQGESGINVPPAGYLKQVREICTRNDVLLVVDEVQTGLGRVGDVFGFQAEDIVPDVITLAKALGGGLMPSGAVLCRPEAYTVHFGLRHSSTFAGNALAAECGIAMLDLLAANNFELLQSIRRTGDYLMHGLNGIKSRFPNLVKDVRGRGLMQAIEFDFSCLAGERGLFPILVDQNLLPHLMISHMLHTHHVRVATTFMGRDVIRLEPALIAGEAECDQLLAALTDALQLVDDRNSAMLARLLLHGPPTMPETGKQPSLPAQMRKGAQVERPNETIVGDFGFLVHLSALDDLVKFEPPLGVFSHMQLAELKHQLTRSSEPTVVGTQLFGSVNGSAVRGHFVLVPYTPSELVREPPGKAIDLIAAAAAVARNANVALIGLGGFTSILTGGGMALDSSALPPLTSGNAYTTAVTLESIENACVQRGIELSDATVAIVGAAGQIGRALALMLSERAARIVLIGRNGHSDRTQSALRKVAGDIVKHLLTTNETPGGTAGKLLEQMMRLSRRTMASGQIDRVDQIAQSFIDSNCIRLATDNEAMRDAKIVIAVSSATEPFINAQHVCHGAIVCDAARPANVIPAAIGKRDDVLWLEGGLVRIPGADSLDLFAGPRPDAAYACVAESVLWTLDPQPGQPNASRVLDVATIKRLAAAGKRHGFELA